MKNYEGILEFSVPKRLLFVKSLLNEKYTAEDHLHNLRGALLGSAAWIDFVTALNSTELLK